MGIVIIHERLDIPEERAYQNPTEHIPSDGLLKAYIIMLGSCNSEIVFCKLCFTIWTACITFDNNTYFHFC